MVPAVSTTTGITSVFTFHMRCIATVRLLLLVAVAVLVLLSILALVCGPGSVVGIATRYGLDGPGIESRCGRDFPHPPRPALGPT